MRHHQPLLFFHARRVPAQLVQNAVAAAAARVLQAAVQAVLTIVDVHHPAAPAVL